jgi:hypothetical protein
VHALPTLVDPRPLGAQIAAAKGALALPTQMGRETLERELNRSQGSPPRPPPLEELGATQGPARARIAPPAKPSDPAHPLGRRRIERAREAIAPATRAEAGGADAARARAARQGIWLGGAALVLVLVAVVVALLWPSPPPLEARVRAADDAQEVVDLSCASCPDGTVLKLRDVEATVRGGQAVLPLPAPLAIGDTPVRIAIDRPEGGRDETVQIPLRVAYRVRPDLSALAGDHPTLQIVVETSDDAKVELDGEPIPVRGGRAVKSIDVRDELADAGELLTRKVAYAVTPPDGEEERGVVSVTVSVLPLSLDAPGRAVVTDQPSFLLAGRTAPGAEVVVAGRAIPVGADGSFSQHMNVSSVGTTKIEVRARASGKAPRLRHVTVQRVASLEDAVREFPSRAPIALKDAVGDPKAAVGRAIALEGEVVERVPRAHQTILVLRPKGDACGSASDCVVRLVQGGTVEAPRATSLRAYGVVAGTVTHEGREVLDVDVAFSLPGSPVVPTRPRTLEWDSLGERR